MQQVELSVSSVLRATCSDIRDTLPHDIARAVVRARSRTRRRVIDPTPTGTVKRPSADLRRSPRAGSSSGPPSRPSVDDTTRGSLDAGRRTHRCPRPFPYEAVSDESAPFPGTAPRFAGRFRQHRKVIYRPNMDIARLHILT